MVFLVTRFISPGFPWRETFPLFILPLIIFHTFFWLKWLKLVTKGIIFVTHDNIMNVDERSDVP